MLFIYRKTAKFARLMMRACFYAILFSLLLNGCTQSRSSDQKGIVWPPHLKVACERLASSYPFSDTSEHELSIDEFNNYFFFGSDLWLYENTIQNRNSVPKKVLEHLQLAGNIRDHFYSDDSPKAALNITIKTHQFIWKFHRLQLYFGERIGPTAVVGPRRLFHYKWPNKAEPLNVRGWTNDGMKWREGFSGDWSLFRFLDKATRREGSNGKIITSVPVRNEVNIEYLVEGFPDWAAIKSAFSCP